MDQSLFIVKRKYQQKKKILKILNLNLKAQTQNLLILNDLTRLQILQKIYYGYRLKKIMKKNHNHIAIIPARKNSVGYPKINFF